jgi:hypothetical protein
MFDYEVDFRFDYFSIRTSVWARTDEEAERVGIERLKEVSGLFIDDMGNYDLVLDVLGKVQ